MKKDRIYVFLHEYRENRSREVDVQSQNILGILYTIILHSARIGLRYTSIVGLKNTAQNERYVSGIFDNEENREE